LSGLTFALIFTLGGCAYRLPVAAMPSQQRLKLLSVAPEAFSLRLRISEPRDYRVPNTGRVTLDVSGYRAACSVYLFDKLRIRRGANPFDERTVDIIVGGKIARQLSLKEISELPTDAEGYHLLPVQAAE
jgi:hypothetical protein